MEPNGTLAMSYCVDPANWAVCTIAAAQDLNPFDPDNGASGILEVTYCVDAPVTGEIKLWYGEYPNRKGMVLREATTTDDAPAHPACHIRHFAPEDACFAQFDVSQMTKEDSAKSVPQKCSGLCGTTLPECALDFHRTTLSLSAEPPPARSAAVVRVRSVRYLPSSCACNVTASCEGTEAVTCRRDEEDACHRDSGACRRGMCVTMGTEDCGDMIGRYADGWKDGPSDAFVAAHLRHSPSLGCPFNDGGGPYVHDARGVDVQTFFQPAQDKRLSSDGQSALILGADRREAWLVFGGFWGAYTCMRDGDAGQIGGASLLGPPAGESHLIGGTVRQDFARGWMTSEDAWVTVHLDEGRVLAPDATSGCTNVR